MQLFVIKFLATGRWFSPGIPISSTNKADRHDTTEILSDVKHHETKQTFMISEMLAMTLFGSARDNFIKY